jgi:uncharacterized membrane protein
LWRRARQLQNRDFMSDAAMSEKPDMPPLWRQLTWWVLLFPAAMLLAIGMHSVYLLNWVHVLSGVLWTGADLFMGFIVGPVLRSLDIKTRTAFIAYLVPRTLLYFPVVALTAGTAGWQLAVWLGFTGPEHPNYLWAMVSFALVMLMAVVGFLLLLPNNLRIWLELKKPQPDRDKIVRLNRYNIWLSGGQGVMQVAMILIMAHFRF